MGLLSSLAFAEAAHAAASQNESRIQQSVAVAFKLPSQIADGGMEIKASDVSHGFIAHQCSQALYLVGLCTKINRLKSLLMGNVGQQQHVCGR